MTTGSKHVFETVKKEDPNKNKQKKVRRRHSHSQNQAQAAAYYAQFQPKPISQPRWYSLILAALLTDYQNTKQKLTLFYQAIKEYLNDLEKEKFTFTHFCRLIFLTFAIVTTLALSLVSAFMLLICLMDMNLRIVNMFFYDTGCKRNYSGVPTDGHCTIVVTKLFATTLFIILFSIGLFSFTKKIRSKYTQLKLTLQ